MKRGPFQERADLVITDRDGMQTLYALPRLPEIPKPEPLPLKATPEMHKSQVDAIVARRIEGYETHLKALAQRIENLEQRKSVVFYDESVLKGIVKDDVTPRLDVLEAAIKRIGSAEHRAISVVANVIDQVLPDAVKKEFDKVVVPNLFQRLRLIDERVATLRTGLAVVRRVLLAAFPFMTDLK